MTRRSQAYCLIREQPHYRRDAFVAGLRQVGYDVEMRAPTGDPAPGDVLLIWNRYGDKDQLAARFEARGGTVLVAENGYLDADRDNRRRYALAVHAHNGRGRWPERNGAQWILWSEGYGARWRALREALRLPHIGWRLDGEHILVAPNRSFGQPGGIMPADWAQQVVRQLKEVTQRPVRVRAHPGNGKPDKPLAEDLDGAHAVVIWSSSVGVAALLAGIQVRCLAPWWICKPATLDRLHDIDTHPGGEREPAFERLAWAQWDVEEIQRGEPFGHLLPAARQAQVEKAA